MQVALRLTPSVIQRFVQQFVLANNKENNDIVLIQYKDAVLPV